MITRRAWRLIRILALGLGITALVATFDHFGQLDFFEHFTYDQRLRHFQHWFAPPSDALVHVLIDDQSVGQIGRWPWPRSTIADIMDEAARDGAAQMAFDIMWTDTDHAEGHSSEAEDQRLAQSIAAAAAAGVPVLLPVSVNSDTPAAEDRVLHRAIEVMSAHPETSTDELADLLHIPVDEVGTTYYSPALSAALPAIARRVVYRSTMTNAQAVAFYFPGATGRGETNAWVRLFQSALDQARVAKQIEETLPPAGLPIGLLKATFTDVPIAPLASAAPCFGYVTYLVGSDGIVRTVPLLMQERDRLVPQFGVAMAAMRLGIDVLNPQQMEITSKALVLHPPGGREIRIPVRVAEAGNPSRTVGALMDISFRGGPDWKHLYDPLRFTDVFIPMLEIWQVANQQHLLDTRMAIVGAGSKEIVAALDPNDPAGRGSPPTDTAECMVLGKHAIDLAAKQGSTVDDALKYFEDQKKLPEKDQDSPKDTGRHLNASIINVSRALPQIPKLRSNVDILRAPLIAKLKGKMLLFGFAETSSVADHVPTSIHPDCPGMVIHGAIANAILSGEMWTHLPPRYAALLTLLCGVVVTLAVTFLTPWRAFAVWISLMAAVAGIASVVLFDYFNIVIGLAGPLTAGTLCWAACTLVVTLRERYDRSIVTRRFRSYVDPALVSYVLENPDRSTMAGETRELTVVFIDVAGFTTLAEKMGEKSIIILRQLMDAMVPIIRAHEGFVNKFLGDGIMFFYGAPKHDPDHARHAVMTVLEMQKALREINKQLVASGLPELGVRAGISTGRMVVGDAGSADASDYTVLGDAVNLGSRLEGANKALGTVALCTARTAELCGDAFLFVPLGRLQVVGKDEAVEVCEPICPLSTATRDQHACADSFREIWEHISTRQAVHALARLDQFRATGERTKICELLHLLIKDLRDDTADKELCIRLSGK